MATMHFCGATGKMFRGAAATERAEWLKCQERERPAPEMAEGGEYDWLNRCTPDCPLYLEGIRRHNDIPYIWHIREPGARPRSQCIAVAGGSIDKTTLRENRRECGRIVRQRTLERARGQREEGEGDG